MQLVSVLLPVAFVVAGLLLHALAAHASLKEFGRALLWSGAFALAFLLASHPLRF